MKLPFRRIYWVSAAFLLLCCIQGVEAQQVSDTRPTATSRTRHSVYGWEKPLVQKSTNLSKYYWCPMTQYTLSRGSGKTRKGAQSAAPGPATVASKQHYVKPKFAALPKNDSAAFFADEHEVGTKTDVSLRYSKNLQAAPPVATYSANDCSGVLTYEKRNTRLKPTLEGSMRQLSVKARIAKPL